VNNTLFFAANDGINGMELWRSDGTEAGTVLVKDINAGFSNSSIGYLTDVNGTLFFVANSGTSGTELWKSNGTAAGTVLVKDIRPGSMGSNPSDLVNANGILFFTADNGSNGVELWKSDGTDAGTVLVKDIKSGSASGYPQSLAAMNDIVFFAADNGVKGIELWKSDGTTAGTTLVKDIWSGSNDGYPFDLTVIGADLYFSANDGGSGTELWKSNGTSSGTVQIKDIWTGSSDGFPYDLLNVGGTLFFSADNGASGIELWKSDGTAAGTVLVKDVWPGSESGAVGNFSKLVNKLVFTGNDGITGYKTWQSDGTASGTKIASGIANTGDGNMQELIETESKIFASISQSDTGSELWGVNFSIVLPVVLLDFTGKLVKDDAVLSWKTADENNMSEFIIERSTDGSTYEPAGRVVSQNTPGIHHYQFTDAGIRSAGATVFYYRLKQVDIDSRFTYSRIISLQTGDMDENKIRLYPNPARNQITIESSTLAGAVHYRVFDANGKIVLRKSEQASAGNSLQLDIDNLSAGVYYLDLRSASLNKKIQFVKQ
jgi:ELWxxDGT repeat protein